MNNLNRRLGKIEKQLGFDQKPYSVNIAGLEMASDEFAELLKEIDGTSKGKLPSEEEISEYQAMYARGTET
ncbi:MAG: hypothetical protein ACYSUY_17485 [Planctomycetota bacterium]|jgi:hypothetical protein